MNINNKYTFKDIFVLNRDVSELLKNLSDQTIKKDLEFLTEIQLINKDGLYYSANVDLLKGKYSKRKEPKKNKKGKIICWNQNMLRIKPRISSRSSSLKVIYSLAGILNTVSQISSEFPII